MTLSPTERFSSRVEAYIKYRPSYPPEIIDYLILHCGLKPEHSVADIGSGTGFLSKLFLDNRNPVICVEPNGPMREAAERNLKEYKNFKSVSGRAEATLLREKSIDFIAAAQAFHWFDPVLTKKEFLRIARPGAKIILLWNRRDSEKDPFQRGYENFLQSRLPEYSAVTHKKIDENIIRNFFAPSALNTVTFNHFQTFDFDGLIGRLSSSSYCPEPADPAFSQLREELRLLFNQHQIGGGVRFYYRTDLYWAGL